LLWYLGICSAIYAAARSGVPDETVKAHQSSPEELVDQITACTHFKKMEWNGKCHTREVRDDIDHLFPFKARLFGMEMLSVILTPVVLCFSLPHCAPDILEFIRNHTTYVDGVGAVCDYSTFDLNKYGNEEFATNTKESTLLEVGIIEVM
jgi:autophagy-related protein 9